MKALVIMGVAGCGKSSLGAALASKLDWKLIEGDDYHPESNREKMRDGIALTDADRQGWLQSLGRELQSHKTGVVLTCSALKLAYRNVLRKHVDDLGFVCLDITREEALSRVTARANDHLFPPSLVDSQFADFEPPVNERDVLQLQATSPLTELTARAAEWIARTNAVNTRTSIETSA